MNVAHPSPRQLMPWQILARGLAGLLIAFMLAWIARPAHAAAPPANTSISNQASATYSDASGMERTVTSNEVKTTVTQVYKVALDPDGVQSATAGSVVYYPHTVTNNGNGTDTFKLEATNDAASQFQMQAGTLLIYADDGTGRPTGAAITASTAIAAGATFKFIVAATLPTTPTVGQKNTINVKASSLGDTTQVATRTDVTTVTSNAVITLTKAVSVASGAPGTGPFTYRLTYTNTGNSDATSVVITDQLPAGLTFETGTTVWSQYTGTIGDTATVTGNAGSTLTMAADKTTHLFKATISKVSPGQSGYLIFSFRVGTSTAPGTLPNTADLAYTTGSPATTPTAKSNTVVFDVTQTAGVTLVGATKTTANAGETVSFNNVVTNNGNGTDTFNITYANQAAPNGFPAGTVFALYKADGVTPLVDTNSDNLPDTGPIAPGTNYTVVLKATLPPNASSATAVKVDKTATSVLDPTQKSTGTDTLNKIEGAKVDLVNSDNTGAGAGPEGTSQLPKTTNPGTTVTFPLVVKNTGPSPDSYNLAASTSSTFATVSLPAGWTIEFKEDASSGTCTTTGATITNTGSVAAGGSMPVCAVVTIPAGYTAKKEDLFFRTLSPTSGVSDTLHDSVTVNAVRSITLTPNGTGQTYPGGSFVFTHTLTNTGNVDEADTTSTLTPTLANNGSGWTSTLYLDSNKDGQLDSGDVVISGDINAVITGALLKGQSITVFNKVIAPSGAVAGTVNSTTITITTVNKAGVTTTAPTPTVATDSTTVIAGNLQLLKVQALDKTCSGTVNASDYKQGNLDAAPGECVMYQITVKNVGAAEATNVIVSDGTPAYTVLKTLAVITSGTGQIVHPGANNAGTIKAFIGAGADKDATPAPKGGKLAAGESATITFGVKISN